MKTTLLTLATLLISSAALAQAPGGGQMPTAEVIMQRNDTNKDGFITKAEATAAGTQMAQNFDMFDANKDGKVTLDELKSMMAAMGQGGPAAAPTPPTAPVAPAAQAAKKN